MMTLSGHGSDHDDLVRTAQGSNAGIEAEITDGYRGHIETSLNSGSLCEKEYFHCLCLASSDNSNLNSFSLIW